MDLFTSYVRFLEWLGCGKYVTMYQGEEGGNTNFTREYFSNEKY